MLSLAPSLPSFFWYVCEERMATLQTVIELGRMVRERNNITFKTPVKEVIVVSKDQGTCSSFFLPSLPPTLLAT